MSSLVVVAPDLFWNIRGHYRVMLKMLDMGTQSSLVKLSSGDYVLLDSYELPNDVKKQVMAKTSGGKSVKAILNLHPFHTVHVKKMHEDFPSAKLYGTSRHISTFPDLPWEQERTESEALHKMFENDFEFSVSRGVDFISPDPSVHTGSVMAYHKASKTIHVDDTFNYVQLLDKVSIHPMLYKALSARAGAAYEFRQWVEEIANKWADAQNLCCAHTWYLLKDANKGLPISERLLAALHNSEDTLKKHAATHG
eukprot:jgi/Mesvir1/11674/Mv00068-RA.1